MADICNARVSGAELGSREISFEPGAIRTGEHRFDVGTAGSTTLILQTLLPALLSATGASRVLIIGGTHNPMAPTFEFIEETFLPLLRQCGAAVDLRLERHGFYPRGGGRLSAAVHGPASWTPLHLLERGPITALAAEILLARLPPHIAARELDVLRGRLGIPAEHCTTTTVVASSPGNVVTVRAQTAHLRTVFARIGTRGTPAETVANALADEVERYEVAEVPVDGHLADQLLLPLALAGDGSFVTAPPSSHTLTNAAVIEAFLDVQVAIRPQAAERFLVSIRRKASRP
jgi:RNA 3'-terminal phosphate cyclase (ATP)